MKLLCRFILGFVLLMCSLTLFAGELPFDQKEFDNLRAAGKPVVVHIHATWCAVCKKQADVVSLLVKDKQFENLTVLRADFDTEKELMKNLNVAYRSTFVAFKGSSEVGRSAGETSQDSISALFAKAL